MWFPFLASPAAKPKIAQLLASVPPLVKMTSLVSQPAAAATVSRDCSMAARVSRPALCKAEALPKWVLKNGAMLVRTWRSVGVAAAWSQ